MSLFKPPYMRYIMEVIICILVPTMSALPTGVFAFYLFTSLTGELYPFLTID